MVLGVRAARGDELSGGRGDAIAQRDSRNGLVIAGVTAVDPAVAADAADPLSISPSVPSSVDPLGGAINLSGMAELSALATIGHGDAAASVDQSIVADEARPGAERVDGMDSAG